MTAMELKARQSRNKRLTLGIPTRSITTEEVTDRPSGVTSATVQREADDLVSMYDREGRRRLIPEGSVRVVLAEGLSLECPYCNSEHESDDPNACPELPKLKYRKCPVCGRRVYDDRAIAEIEEDPLAIPTPLPNTPEDRTRAKLDEHIIAYHRTHARQMGLVRPDPAPPGP